MQQQHQRLGFIGAGNMASSLIAGLIADGVDPGLIDVSDVNQAALDRLRDRHHIHPHQDNLEVAAVADVLILAVKPQLLQTVIGEMAPLLRERRPLIISIAAGVTSNSLARWIGDHPSIIRTMPNTPAMVQCGATGLFAREGVTDHHRSTAESILRAVGLTVWVNQEAALDAVTALSGSGPAYFFLLMEAMEEAGVALGLDRETARLLAQQTALGAGRMAIESEDPPRELRRKVTSPGGTTEQAIASFEAGGFAPLVHQAMKAATIRSKELSQQLGG
ncbi:MAG: pyrroline-5-carboxylate reductase [Gammaproteobacteria bacterium]|nr:pyrroline-5-carboxylate reductase [Gammaproteobacteria bacterium]NBT44034.1 pyrroline-5-carboxylate reductase [Gammaproteobacteria bacterium]NBY21498.1 pyrroline-5-carboxylate reductase [Gammaproteobacteria bacterium]